MVLFDRSWYNRAGVERVMGFCTEEQVEESSAIVPEFERMLVRSGIILIKYWFSISDEEQEQPLPDPHRTTRPSSWKLSPDGHRIASALGRLFQGEGRDAGAYTDIKQAPWYVVDAD